jgi:multiple sugar transport system ATP-binding protein
MTLGDRVAIMRDGVLQQFDGPQQLYDRPRNLFVAEFIGSPAMNLIGVNLERSDGGFLARFAGADHSLEVDERVLKTRPGLKRFEGKRLILGVRPEDIEDAALAGGAPDGPRLSAVVDIREDMGSEVFAHFDVGGKAVRGEDVKAAVGADAAEVADVKGNVWVARLDRDTKAREQDEVELVVDTSRLHFFDPETGDGIYA